MRIKNNRNFIGNSGKKSTLLIPDNLFLPFEKMKKKHAGVRSMIRHLLYKFYKKPVKIPVNNKISSKVIYQEKGLDLHRVDFRAEETEWIEMKLLASSMNISICYLFALLVRLEVMGELDVAGVPTKSYRISLYQSINSNTQRPKFTKFYQLRL